MGYKTKCVCCGASVVISEEKKKLIDTNVGANFRQQRRAIPLCFDCKVAGRDDLAEPEDMNFIKNGMDFSLIDTPSTHQTPIPL